MFVLASYRQFRTS